MNAVPHPTTQHRLANRVQHRRSQRRNPAVAADIAQAAIAASNAIRSKIRETAGRYPFEPVFCHATAARYWGCPELPTAPDNRLHVCFADKEYKYRKQGAYSHYWEHEQHAVPVDFSEARINGATPQAPANAAVARSDVNGTGDAEDAETCADSGNSHDDYRPQIVAPQVAWAQCSARCTEEELLMTALWLTSPMNPLTSLTVQELADYIEQMPKFLGRNKCLTVLDNLRRIAEPDGELPHTPLATRLLRHGFELPCSPYLMDIEQYRYRMEAAYPDLKIGIIMPMPDSCTGREFPSMTSLRPEDQGHAASIHEAREINRMLLLEGWQLIEDRGGTAQLDYDHGRLAKCVAMAMAFEQVRNVSSDWEYVPGAYAAGKRPDLPAAEKTLWGWYTPAGPSRLCAPPPAGCSDDPSFVTADDWECSGHSEYDGSIQGFPDQPDEDMPAF